MTGPVTYGTWLGPWGRLVAVVNGLACVAVSGPVANIAALTCDVFLGSWCAEDPHPMGMTAQRALACFLLFAGLALIAIGIGASKAMNAPAHWAMRVLFVVRWLPAILLPAVAAAAALSYRETPQTSVAVDVTNLPQGHALEIIVNDEIEREGASSKYLESFDILFGFPLEYGNGRVVASQAPAVLKLRSPRLSFERWKQAGSTIDVIADGRGHHSDHFQVLLDPCDGCGTADATVSQLSAEPCKGPPSQDDNAVRCRVQQLRYPRGAPTVRLTVDYGRHRP